jgi:hypothetical protein
MGVLFLPIVEVGHVDQRQQVGGEEQGEAVSKQRECRLRKLAVLWSRSR